MALITIEENKIDNFIKERVLNIFKNKKDLMRFFEDQGMKNAIDEGMKSRNIGEEEIFKTLGIDD